MSDLLITLWSRPENSGELFGVLVWLIGGMIRERHHQVIDQSIMAQPTRVLGNGQLSPRSKLSHEPRCADGFLIPQFQVNRGQADDGQRVCSSEKQETNGGKWSLRLANGFMDLTRLVSHRTRKIT